MHKVLPDAPLRNGHLNRVAQFLAMRPQSRPPLPAPVSSHEFLWMGLGALFNQSAPLATINGSKTLQAWRDRHSRSPRPRAASTTEIVTRNAARERESDPAKEAEGADWGIEFARLIDDAQPHERAKLNELEDEQRKELVVILRQDPDNYDRILGAQAMS